MLQETIKKYFAKCRFMDETADDVCIKEADAEAYDHMQCPHDLGEIHELC